LRLEALGQTPSALAVLLLAVLAQPASALPVLLLAILWLPAAALPVLALSILRLPTAALSVLLLAILRLAAAALPALGLSILWLAASPLSVLLLTAPALPRGLSAVRLFSALSAWVLGFGAAHLFVELIGQRREHIVGPLQGLLLVAQDALGRLLHAFSEPVDALVGLLLGRAGLVDETSVDQGSSDVQGVFHPFLPRLAERVVEPLGHQRLGLFGLFDRPPHVFQELPQVLGLLLEALADLFLLCRIAEPLGLRSCLVEVAETLGQLIFVLVEPLGVVAELPDLFGEPVGGLPAELLAHLLELPLGAGAAGNGPGDLPFAEGLGRLPDVLPRLFEVLAGLRHPLVVLRLLHLLAELVGVAEDLLLLLAEPLKLPLDLLALLLGLRLLEGRLEFPRPLVQVGLPAGQIAEPVEYLAILLLGLLGPLVGNACLPLGFIAVLGVAELELLKLLLKTVLGAARGAGAALPLLCLLPSLPALSPLPALSALTLIGTKDLELAGTELQEALVCRLLGQ
jgi:hypothetical protein